MINDDVFWFWLGLDAGRGWRRGKRKPMPKGHLLGWLMKRHGVKTYRTPQDVMEAQLNSWDKILPRLEKDPFFRKVLASQKAFAHRVAFYDLMNSADYKLAFDHYFPGELEF